MDEEIKVDCYSTDMFVNYELIIKKDGEAKLKIRALNNLDIYYYIALSEFNNIGNDLNESRFNRLARFLTKRHREELNMPYFICANTFDVKDVLETLFEKVIKLDPLNNLKHIHPFMFSDRLKKAAQEAVQEQSEDRFRKCIADKLAPNVAKIKVLDYMACANDAIENKEKQAIALRNFAIDITK